MWEDSLGMAGGTLTGATGEATEIVLVLSHDEATDLFFRCLRSSDDDSEVSERVLSKLARAMASANETELRLAA